MEHAQERKTHCEATSKLAILGNLLKTFVTFSVFGITETVMLGGIRYSTMCEIGQIGWLCESRFSESTLPSGKFHICNQV